MNEYVIYVLSILFSIFVVIALVAFSKWHDLVKERELRKLVTWSILCDNSVRTVDGHDLPLWSYLSNAQIKFQLPAEFRITGDSEWDYAKEILKEYETNLTKSYFIGNLKLIKSKYPIRGEDYFMFALCSFLSGHQCDYEFLGQDMHKERLEYKRYGDWGGPCYDATYSLTDFAVVFHKMYYIAYLFCKNSKAINPDEEYFQNEKDIKEILDTKQLQVSAGL